MTDDEKAEFIEKTADLLTQRGWVVVVRVNYSFADTPWLIAAYHIQGQRHIIHSDKLFDAFDYLHHTILK